MKIFPVPNTRMVGARLPVDLDESLESLASALMRSKGDLIREAIRRLIGEYTEKFGLEETGEEGEEEPAQLSLPL